MKMARQVVANYSGLGPKTSGPRYRNPLNTSRRFDCSGSAFRDRISALAVRCSFCKVCTVFVRTLTVRSSSGCNVHRVHHWEHWAKPTVSIWPLSVPPVSFRLGLVLHANLVSLSSTSVPFMPQYGFDHAIPDMLPMKFCDCH